LGKRRILTAKGPTAGVSTTRVVVAREFQRGGRRVAYCEVGVGAPLLLIHGLGASYRWFFPLFPALTSANLRLVALDLPGFGRSPGPVLSIAAAAREVVDLADRLGFARFSLCGHSMGAAIAAHLAGNFGSRVRRLALIDSAGLPDLPPKRWLVRLLQPWSWCPPRFYATLIGDVLRAGPRNMAAGARDLRRYDIRPALDQVRVPTLVIWGERDALTPLEHAHLIVERLADGRLEVISGARHLPMVSHPEATGRLLAEFFGKDLHRGV
jgi:pimeloyl-ACP methyl ester carboxylesterase